MILLGLGKLGSYIICGLFFILFSPILLPLIGLCYLDSLGWEVYKEKHPKWYLGY